MEEFNYQNKFQFQIKHFKALAASANEIEIKLK